MEQAAGNIIEESICELMIDDQCEVGGVGYGGKLIEVVDEMEDCINDTKFFGGMFIVLGMDFVIYLIYRELSKVKCYLIDWFSWMFGFEGGGRFPLEIKDY